MANATSQQPLFGRAWSLTIHTAPDGQGNSKDIVVSSSEWDPESLRVTFEVSLAAYKSPWLARIEIYNANSNLMQTVLKQGMGVTLKAGYQLPGFGTIFEGQIYQPLWKRVEGTDFKLTLLCYAALKESIGNFTSFSGVRGSTQSDLIAQMCASAHAPIMQGAVDTTALSNTQLPRARAFFGDPHRFFQDVAAANNMQAWVGFDGLNLNSYEAANTDTTITFGPTTGLIGSPEQTQDGVEFKVLLDPRLVITGKPLQAKLDMTSINQRPRYIGDYPSILDNDGVYIIVGVDFVGDSRGNDWYAHCVGITSVGGKLGMLGAAAGTTIPDRNSQR